MKPGDLRGRAAELRRRAAELRAQLAMLRARSLEQRAPAELDRCIAELADCTEELYACAAELHAHTQSPGDETSPPKAKAMTRTQVDVAGRILESSEGLIRPVGPGRWGIEARRGQGEWSVGVVTVRAMEAQGWIERSQQRAESWRDPRRLTDAGREALQAATGQRRPVSPDCEEGGPPGTV